MAGDKIRTGLLAAAGLTAAALLARYFLKSKPLATQAKVKKLFVYPVKSCAGQEITEAQVEAEGFKYDREWAVFEAQEPHKIITQRDIPKMRLVQASIDFKNEQLVLNIGDEGVVAIPLALTDESSPSLPIHVWNITGTVRRCDDFVDSKLSEFLGKEVFLGKIKSRRVPSTSGGSGVCVPDQKAEVRLQDFSSLHVLGEESIAWVRKETKNDDISYSRFRPNIVVEGAGEFAEDRWLRFSIGPIEVLMGKLCARCSIPTINDNAERDPKYWPTGLLKKKRGMFYTHKARKEGDQPQPMLGQNSFHRGTGVISVGDTVSVLEFGPEPKFE